MKMKNFNSKLILSKNTICNLSDIKGGWHEPLEPLKTIELCIFTDKCVKVTDKYNTINTRDICRTEICIDPSMKIC